MITYTIKSGGSGHCSGIHYYMDVSRCPRKAYLNSLSERKDLSDNYNLQIGTLTHIFMELYYGKGHTGPIKLHNQAGMSVSPDAKAFEEAQRLFRAYRQKFPLTEFDEIVEIEEAYPKTEEQAEIITDLFDISPFTFQPDMVVRVGQQKAANIKLFDESPLPAGTYMIDWKTAGRRMENRQIVRENSLQFLAYQLAWNALHPDNPLDGLLCRVLYKLKEPTFETILVPPVNEYDLTRMKEWFKQVKYLLDNNPRWANIEQCTQGIKPCWFLMNNTCDRLPMYDESDTTTPIL